VLDATSTDNARAIELFRASGALNPNVTLDTLMDVSRQLAEQMPRIRQDDGWRTFIHRASLAP
jgi:hypothetical protein